MNKQEFIHFCSPGRQAKHYAPINVKPGGEGGYRGDFDRSLWPRVGHSNNFAVPGVGIFEFLFVPMTTNHFPGWGISVILTSHFCPGVGNLTAIFFEKVKIPPYAPLPPPHPPA